jgi:thiamine-phosphate pyrophosphorylase
MVLLMRYEWTPAVTRALQDAQLDARRLGVREVEPDHLLHGLLAEEEGRAVTLLSTAGTDLARARQTLAARSIAGPPLPTETPLPFASRTRAVLDAARDLAVEHEVPSETVLLALLRTETALRSLLESCGLEFALLESSFQIGQGPPMELDEPLQLEEATERVDLARILDAAANRAREALRVVEDYVRFALDDAFLSRELKELRHDLVAVLERFGPAHEWTATARDTRRDVGTAITTPTEQRRHSLLAVVQTNLKRLEEALRSLEEFGKIHSPDLGAALEQLRYRSYTMEKAVLLGTTARERLADARLYVLMSGRTCAAALDWTIQEAAAGGADIIQLREKRLDDQALLERARNVRRWTRKAGVLFILNDRPDLARLAEADGVHLGQDDLPIREARRILGPEALIGVSTHNVEQLRQAVLDGASYVGVGPTFPSGTKEFAEFAGLDYVRQAAAETSLPAFVLGGINLETIEAAVAEGARRVAVSAAVCQADDPQQAAAELRRALGQ